jgi:hypothetical protein
MRNHFLAAGLTCFAVVFPAQAETPPSPLRLVPEQVDFFIQVRQPRRLADTLAGLDTLRRLQEFSAVREGLASTKARRGLQFLAYVEKELGAPWPELLDRLAGGGAVLAAKGGPNPALLVLQGKDAALTKKFLALAVKIAREEAVRQESKDYFEKAPYHDTEVVRIAKDLVVAAAGTALLASNNPEALRRAIDLQRGQGKGLADRPELADAAKLLPPDPLINLWLNLETVRKTPPAKALYKKPRDNGQLTALFGGYLDVLGRALWLTASLGRDGDGFLLNLRLPAGRDGMGEERALFVSPDDRPGSRPVLEPKGVLYSDSSFYDLSRLWEDRGKLFNDKQRQGLEKFDENSGKFLSGMRLSKLLKQAGPYLRFVAVNQPVLPYTTKPKQPIPAFAVVIELREPEEFARSMSTVLRGAALLALTQTKLKLVEEKHAACDLVGWRFDEAAPLRQDINDIRFNFSPCFARVGNQFVLSSTLELGRELIDLLKKELGAKEGGARATSRSRVYAAGIADALAAAEDQLLAQTILDQALPPDEGRAQVKAFIELVRQLGALRSDVFFDEKEFRYDLRFGAGK